MRARGCPYAERLCRYPHDVLANITPIELLGGGMLKYYIEWDSYYRNAPIQVRTARVCAFCTSGLLRYFLDLQKESLQIDRYYERSDNAENTAREGSAHNPPRSGRATHLRTTGTPARQGRQISQRGQAGKIVAYTADRS